MAYSYTTDVPRSPRPTNSRSLSSSILLTNNTTTTTSTTTTTTGTYHNHHHHHRRPRPLHRSSSTAAFSMQIQFPGTLQQHHHQEHHHPNVHHYSTTTHNPRFSYLLNSVLGSPFLTTDDAPVPSYLNPVHDSGTRGDPMTNYDEEQTMLYADNQSQAPLRPPSPTPTADYSFIDPDEIPIPGSFPAHSYHPHHHSYTAPERSISASFAAGLGFHSSRSSTARGRSYYNSSYSVPGTADLDNQHDSSPHPSNPFKTLLPRLWDALATPGRTVFSAAGNNNGSSTTTTTSSSPSPDNSPTIPISSDSLSFYGSGEGTSQHPFSLSTSSSPLWTSTRTLRRNSSPFRTPTPKPRKPKDKGKGKSPAYFPTRAAPPPPPPPPPPSTPLVLLPSSSSSSSSKHQPQIEIDYRELSPLDGEEGELIVIDEACFVPDVRRAAITAVTGLDFLARLPSELALGVLCWVARPPVVLPTPRSAAFGSLGLLLVGEEECGCGDEGLDLGYFKEREERARVALRTILACLGVSKTWRRLVNDNEVWKALFLGRWEGGVDLRRAREGSEYIRIPEPPRLLQDPFVADEEEEVGKGRGRKKRRMNLNKHKWNFRMNKAQRQQDRRQQAQNHNSLAPITPFSQLPIIEITKLTPDPTAPLSFDWKKLYMQKLELEKRWRGTSYIRTVIPAPAPTSTTSLPISGALPLTASVSASTPISETSSWVGIELDESDEEQMGGGESTPVPSWSSTTTRRRHNNLLTMGMNHIQRRSRSLSPARLLFSGGQRTVNTVGGDRERGFGANATTPEIRDVFTAEPEEEMSTMYRETKWEPEVMELSGHRDSVYCVEFDSKRIITGSRDRSIMVWSLKTGKLLGSFHAAHRGSVLCLKFERDWDSEGAESDDNDGGGGNNDLILASGKRKRAGFMVSGSSDCTIRVWNLETGAILEEETGLNHAATTATDSSTLARRDGEGDRVVNAEPIAVLKGHTGGVLDLRINKRWIVSCSKDTVIRVWDRRTLAPYRILRGHEGPVNAIGLQSGRVVSASGDGKMILWDIESGERLRTFDGYDRGLACIEFKGDLIISGSNDCMIRLWRASTGECVRTIAGHSALVRALSFDPSTGRLVSASYDKLIKIWDLHSGELVREFKRVHTSHIFDVKFDVGKIVSTSHDQKICVLDFTAGLDASVFV